MSEQNKTAVRRWFEEVWNRGDDAAIDEMVPRHGVGHGLGDSEQDVHGPDQFRIFVANMRGAIPDIHVAVDDLIAEGDRVAARITVEGTHSGPGLGVEPTGRKIRFQGIVILRFAGGMMVEAWNSYDQLGLFRQAGVIPSPGGRDRLLTRN